MPGVQLEGAPAQHQRQLQPEELVEDQAPARRPHDRRRLGQVDGPERLGPAPQVEGGPPLLGQRVRQLAGAVERLLDVGADLPARQAGLGRRRVDRQDAQRATPGADRGGDDVDDRVDHLSAAPVLPDLPPEDGLGPRLELLGPPGLVEEHHGEASGGVAHHHVDDGAAVPRPPRSHRLHRGEHGRLVAGPQVGDIGLTGAVDVPARVRGEQVEHRLDAELFQTLDLRRGHGGEHRHRSSGEVAQGAAAIQSPTGTGTGLSPVVHLERDVRVLLGQPLLYRPGVGLARTLALDEGDQLVRLVEQPGDEQARAHDHRVRHRDDPVARDADVVARSAPRRHPSPRRAPPG